MREFCTLHNTEFIESILKVNSNEVVMKPGDKKELWWTDIRKEGILKSSFDSKDNEFNLKMLNGRRLAAVTNKKRKQFPWVQRIYAGTI